MNDSARAICQNLDRIYNIWVVDEWGRRIYLQAFECRHLQGLLQLIAGMLVDSRLEVLVSATQ